MANQRTKAIRQALAELWKKSSGLKGWCWEPKDARSGSGGTSLVLERKGEIVAVSEQNGRVVIREFRQTEKTELGEKVREILSSAGLLQAEDKKPFSLVPGYYTWRCDVCGRWGQVDPTGMEDYVLINRLYSEHHEAAQKAGHSEPHDNKVKIIDDRGQECKNLQELAALQKVG